MMRSVVGDRDGNIERARRLAREAAGRGAEVLVLPEACLTGYTVRGSMGPWAETVPGPLTEAVRGLAVEFDLAILAGLVERSEAGLHLTQVLVGPGGLHAAYRKTHLGPTEKTLFVPGNRLGVVHYMVGADDPGVSLGLQLCYEGHFPEVSLAQALAGADALIVPHASPREDAQSKLDRWLRYFPARAYDNTVFVVACNQVGDNGGGLTFSGVALILGPKGEVLAQAAGEDEAVIVADLRAEELEAVRGGRMGYFLPERRPELYGKE